MDEAVRALCIIEGAIEVLDDEIGADGRPRLKACVAALERAAELLGDHVDSLEGGAFLVHPMQ